MMDVLSLAARYLRTRRTHRKAASYDLGDGVRAVLMRRK